jgi:cytoskeletal protein RodZ
MKGMSTVAEQLRSAREARKLTVEQVAEATKIRTDYIRALEDGNFNVFSAQIYIRGSVKNYAAMLKLDVPALLAALDDELDLTEKYSEPPPLVESENTLLDQVTLLLAKINWKLGFGILVLAAIITVLVISIWVWRHHQKGDSLKSIPPAVYQPASSGDTLPLPKK